MKIQMWLMCAISLCTFHSSIAIEANSDISLFEDLAEANLMCGIHIEISNHPNKDVAWNYYAESLNSMLMTEMILRKKAVSESQRKSMLLQLHNQKEEILEQAKIIGLNEYESKLSPLMAKIIKKHNISDIVKGCPTLVEFSRKAIIKGENRYL